MITKTATLSKKVISWQTEAGTVYSGSLDVATGLLTVDRGYVLLDGQETWQIQSGNTANQKFYHSLSSDGAKALADAVCNRLVYTDLETQSQPFGVFKITSAKNFLVYDGGKRFSSVDDFETWLGSNNLQVVFDLATPVTYQLSAQEIKTLTGANNIFCDTGNIQGIVYSQDTSIAVTDLIQEALSEYGDGDVDGYGGGE